MKGSCTEVWYSKLLEPPKGVWSLVWSPEEGIMNVTTKLMGT
jgi:hypothetical protein